MFCWCYDTLVLFWKLYSLNHLELVFPRISKSVKHTEGEREWYSKWCSMPAWVLLLLVCLHWQGVDTAPPFQHQRLFTSLWWMWHTQKSATLFTLESYVETRALCNGTWSRLDGFEWFMCEGKRWKQVLSDVLRLKDVSFIPTVTFYYFQCLWNVNQRPCELSLELCSGFSLSISASFSVSEVRKY